MRMWAVLVVAAAIAAAAGRVDGTCTAEIMTSHGPVRGVCNTTLPDLAFRAFKGIPFAADTSGANRFMPPQPRAKWSSVLNAADFGPGCPQTHHNPDVPSVQSEDCLSVNVWTPYDAKAGDKLPVTVFVYGGTFAEGSAQSIFGLYKGYHLTTLRNNTIWVTFNYRVAGLGYLSLPPNHSSSSSTPMLAGNQGMQDQRAALQWVRDNIAAFGGDPGNVMLQGESAGGMSIICHMTSPASAGLFHSVLIESGVPGYRYRSAEYAQFQGLDLAAQLGCTDDSTMVKCMQAAPLANVLNAIRATSKDPITFLLENGLYPMDGFVNWSPVVTGPGTDEIPLQPLDAIAAGKFNAGLKSVVLGTNANESVAFLGNKGTNVNAIEYDLAITGLYGLNGAKLIKSDPLFRPPLDPVANGIPAMEQWLTAYWFECPSRYLAAAMAAHGVPTWLYKYDHRLSFDVFGKFLPQCRDYVCHGAEMPVFFGSHLNFTFNAGEKALSRAIMSYELSASTFNDPNAGWTPPVHWPAYTAAANTRIHLNDTITVQTVPDYCQGIFDKLGYNH